MEWGTRVSGGVGRARPRVAPSQGKGFRGSAGPRAAATPRCREGEVPSRRSAHCAPAPVSPPALRDSHRKRNSAWPPPLGAARRGDEDGPGGSPRGGAYHSASVSGRPFSAAGAARTGSPAEGSRRIVPTRAERPQRRSALPAGPGCLGSGVGPPVARLPQPLLRPRPPTRTAAPHAPSPCALPTRRLRSPTGASRSPGPGEARWVRPRPVAATAPRCKGPVANNRQRQGLRGRGRRNTDFNEDYFPLV